MSAVLPAIILIGEPGDAMARAAGVAARGFIAIDGQSMLARLAATLRECGSEFVIVGSPDLQTAAAAVSDARFVSAPVPISQKLRAGMAALGNPRQAMMCAADSPFVTAEGLCAFMRVVVEKQLDLAYPIVPREVCDAAFPGGQRTYVRMRDGTFTGGNFLVLSSTIVNDRSDWIERFFAARKSPLQLAKMLGAMFLLKLALGRMTVAAAERHFTRRFGIRAAAVVSQDAGMGFDIDKPADLELARAMMRGER